MKEEQSAAHGSGGDTGRERPGMSSDGRLLIFDAGVQPTRTCTTIHNAPGRDSPRRTVIPRAQHYTRPPRPKRNRVTGMVA